MNNYLPEPISDG